MTYFSILASQICPNVAPIYLLNLVLLLHLYTLDYSVYYSQITILLCISHFLLWNLFSALYKNCLCFFESLPSPTTAYGQRKNFLVIFATFYKAYHFGLRVVGTQNLLKLLNFKFTFSHYNLALRTAGII